MPSKKLRIPQFHYKCNYYIANMKFLAKNFAIIIIFRKNNASFDKRKTPQIIDLQRFVDYNLWFKWCHRDSNQGHKDFQSFALPTELWHQHLYSAYLIQASAKVTIFFVSANFYPKIFYKIIHHIHYFAHNTLLISILHYHNIHKLFRLIFCFHPLQSPLFRGIIYFFVPRAR